MSELELGLLDDEEEFLMRREKNDEIILYTAVKTYQNKKKNLEIKLAGDIHIAEEAYFHGLIEELNLCDKVLYEGIIPSELSVWDKFTVSYHFMKSLKKHYEGLKRNLRLELKADVLKGMFEDDIFREKWEHCDVNLKEFIRRKKSRRERGLYIAFILDRPIYERFGKQNPELVKGQMIMTVTSKHKIEMGDAVGEHRNKRVYSRLEELCEAKSDYKIGVLYGAKHTPDFADYITKNLGFVRKDEKWFKAFEAKHPAVL